MQSTNTTHNKNLKNPRKGSFSAIAKPIEDTVNGGKRTNMGQVKDKPGVSSGLSKVTTCINVQV